MTKTTEEFTVEELIAIYLAAGGKITKCPNGIKKNYSKNNIFLTKYHTQGDQKV